jgi:hypothetical protein
LGTNQDNIADRISKGRPGGRPPAGSDREPLFGRRKRKPRAGVIKFGDLVRYEGKLEWCFISRFNNIPPVNSRRGCSIINTRTGEILGVRLNELELASRKGG